jgi:hypothetical protein
MCFVFREFHRGVALFWFLHRYAWSSFWCALCWECFAEALHFFDVFCVERVSQRRCTFFGFCTEMHGVFLICFVLREFHRGVALFLGFAPRCMEFFWYALCWIEFHRGVALFWYALCWELRVLSFGFKVLGLNCNLQKRLLIMVCFLSKKG